MNRVSRFLKKKPEGRHWGGFCVDPKRTEQARPSGTFCAVRYPRSGEGRETTCDVDDVPRLSVERGLSNPLKSLERARLNDGPDERAFDSGPPFLVRAYVARESFVVVVVNDSSRRDRRLEDKHTPLYSLLCNLQLALDCAAGDFLGARRPLLPPPNRITAPSPRGLSERLRAKMTRRICVAPVEVSGLDRLALPHPPWISKARRNSRCAGRGCQV